MIDGETLGTNTDSVSLDIVLEFGELDSHSK